MKNQDILCVFDESAKIENFYQYRGGKEKIFLAPLTINEKCISSVLQKVNSLNESKNILISFTHLFNEKAFSIRDDYIKFIYDFGEMKVFRDKNLKEYFKPLFGNFSTWWFSLIAEKNTLKTKSFHNLVKLLTILDLRKKYNCEKIWIDIENPELTQALIENIGKENCKDLRKYKKRIDFFHILFLIVKMIKEVAGRYRNLLWAKIVMRRLNQRKKILQKGKYLIVTYFPNVDKEALKNKRFVNKYYHPLQNILEEKYKGQFTWLAMVAESEEFDYKKSLFLGREINKWGDSLFFCEEWLNSFDFLIVTLEFLYISFKFFIKLIFIKNRFKFQNKKIWKIFKEDWYLSFSGCTLVEGLFYYRAFRKIFNQLQNGTTIAYLAENHAWEKALNVTAYKGKRLKTVGIQHTAVPLLLLNYFNDKKELEKGDYTQKMPKPDSLGCVGKIPSELFKKSGWDEKQIFILGTMRHQYLKNYLKNEVSWKEKENRIAVALSIMPEESKEILLYAYYAFKDSSGYKVIIKGHPFLDTKRLINSLNLNFDERIFQITKTPLSQLLPKAKCLIVTESSASLEGIAFGCVIIVPRLTNVVDMNPLSGISDLPIFVESPKELREVAEKTMERSEHFYLYEQCKNLLEQYFDFPHTDKEFLERLEKQ